MLSLYAEAVACPAHQEIEGLIEGADVIDCRIGAVESCGVVTLQRRASSQKTASTRHNFQVLDSLAEPLGFLIRYHLLIKPVLSIPIACFLPRLSTLVFFYPPCVSGLVDEVLVRA